MSKYIYILSFLTFGLYCSALGQLNPMTNYVFTNPGTNQLGISAVFDQTSVTNVTLDNSFINILVPSDYQIDNLTNTWSVELSIDEATLVGFCGPSATGYSYYQIGKQNNQNLGVVTQFVAKPLTVITFTGISSEPVIGLTFPISGTLQTCISQTATNTSSIQWGIGATPFEARSDIPISPQSILLPIHLSSFSAKKHTERSSRLNWKTSSEINSDYFGIERSQDGNNWETIGRVTAAGNSSSELTYEFIDDNLPLIRSKEQLFYYRLRMTDLDGQFKYSDVRGVNFGKLSEGVVTIYPNPTVEHINVDLSGMDLDAGKVELFVYDMTGRQMIKKSIIGNGIELIDVSLLPASTYNVVVKQGETAYQQRVIKID